MGVPNRLGMKDWIVLETLEDAHNMTVVAGMWPGGSLARGSHVLERSKS